MEHDSRGVVILLAETFDGIGTFQFVDRKDIELADGGVQSGEVIVEMLRC